MKFTKKDYRDLLKLADIIEKKEFFNQKDEYRNSIATLPEDKRNGSQFNLQAWFFDCGMPACAAGHAVCEFPKRFGYNGYVKGKREDKNGNRLEVNFDSFADAFNLDYYDGIEITDYEKYFSENPKPKTVAKRIRMIAQKALEAKP